jgi:adenosylmethionine-8-amino-7-oxononanoate aminotransferase
MSKSHFHSVNVESNSCVSVTFFLQGSYVYDDTGKKYLDSLAGLWCTALGILPSNTTKHELMFLFLQFGIP